MKALGWENAKETGNNDLGGTIGPVLGDGVEDAKKLVREAKKDEVDVMKVLDLGTSDLKGQGVAEARFRLALLLAEDAEKNLTLTDQERAATNQEATALLEKLGKEDGLNDALKKRVTDLLCKVGHLVVGCEAPEIEGAGEKFRLSEYRGKVVFLPFWGMW